MLSSHPSSTHIWERITTVSSSNATAVASPMSRPRKTAAKKVTTQIICKECVDISSYMREWDSSHKPAWEQLPMSCLLRSGPSCPYAFS